MHFVSDPHLHSICPANGLHGECRKFLSYNPLADTHTFDVGLGMQVGEQLQDLSEDVTQLGFRDCTRALSGLVSVCGVTCNHAYNSCRNSR